MLPSRERAECAAESWHHLRLLLNSSVHGSGRIEAVEGVTGRTPTAEEGSHQHTLL